MTFTGKLVVALLSVAIVGLLMSRADAMDKSIINKDTALKNEKFWDNRDFGWYKENIPFFECPDPEITTTWYYRWELVTKHLTYGSPNSGYSFTEFIDRPFWSGAYGAISCPAGHQLYEIRWLKNPRFARDYSQYWFKTPGAQPRNYSTWLADAILAANDIHPSKDFVTSLLPDLIANYKGWEKRQFVADKGLFWQIGHDDGMEFNINSRQTKDILRGAPGFRPSFNAYMWADANAIATIGERAGNKTVATEYRAKSASIKSIMQKLLWDPKREFFFPMFRDNEIDKDGNKVVAGTLTYQSGKYAGSDQGREEIGFVPWQFNMPDAGYESAWKFLMDPNYFMSAYGPTTVGQKDPMFYLSQGCCWWSGRSWPYATTQTLKAMANLLHNYKQNYVSRDDYLKLLTIYTMTQRKNGLPYIAEAADPFNGSWEGHDSYNHSEHYFHSGYNDLIISGLVGLKPSAGNKLEIDPLAPTTWSYFCLDEVPYHGHMLSVVWDKDGERYHLGSGLTVLMDGKKVGHSNTLAKLSVNITEKSAVPVVVSRFNHAVNNDGDYYPQISATYSNPNSPVTNANDGNYRYTIHPPNRWTTLGSPNSKDSLTVDFGMKRRVDTVKLYILDDDTGIAAPSSYVVEMWDGTGWTVIKGLVKSPKIPEGHMANTAVFTEISTERIRVTFVHAPKGKAGLTEIEAWGPDQTPYKVAPPPAGNLALNTSGLGFPKATASFHDVYGGVPERANDGKTVYNPTPVNRWTSYGSTNPTDWLEIDFGTPKEIGRVELRIYDDRGGVQAPVSYNIQIWTGTEWRDASGQVKSPERPVGSSVNTVKFAKQTTSKFRVVFTHKTGSKSGVTEILAWKE